MGEQIESVLKETRSFSPSQAFQKRARLSSVEAYERMHAESIRDPEGFWRRVAGEIPWMKPFEQVLDWSEKPAAAVTSATRTPRADRAPIVWATCSA